MPNNCADLPRIENINKKFIVNPYEVTILDNAVLTITKNLKLPIIQMILKCPAIEFSNIVSITSIMVAAFHLVRKLFDGTPIHTIINCESIDYFDSSAIGAFIEVKEKAKWNNTIIALCNLKSEIYKKIQIIKADEFIPIFNTAKDAQKYILDTIYDE
jgi:anti-anti-sigma factor